MVWPEDLIGRRSKGGLTRWMRVFCFVLCECSKTYWYVLLYSHSTKQNTRIQPPLLRPRYSLFMTWLTLYPLLRPRYPFYYDITNPSIMTSLTLWRHNPLVFAERGSRVCLTWSWTKKRQNVTLIKPRYLYLALYHYVISSSMTLLTALIWRH